MKNEYDLIADIYEDFFDKEEFREEDSKLAEIMPYPSGDVLDIGCGQGLAFYLLFAKVSPKDPKVISYYGIDPSQKMLDKFGVPSCYEKVQTEKTTFEDFKTEKKFDLIVSTYASMSYIEPTAIGKIKDLLNAGGKFFLMFSKDDYEPITHKLAKGIVEMSVHKFTEYRPFLSAISDDVVFKEWDNYMIAEGTV